MTERPSERDGPGPLPVDDVRAAFEAALDERGRVVLTAPTGSGKSTRVPVWCAARGHRVLVVEPRRVACRTLASYVAELEESGAGGLRVGYAIRHEHRYDAQTDIVFATPGTVLQWIQRERRRQQPARREGDFLSSWDVLVLDEFHERRVDTDLLLALALDFGVERLVLMSATLQAERIAQAIEARLMRAEGRLHPVHVEHREEPLLPDVRGLEARVTGAVESALEATGDILVFLPGKGEIAACRDALRGLARRRGLEVMPLHGDLPSSQQLRPFASSGPRRVVLATNVAETSVTLPRVGVVVDSGLVRETRYHWGRSVLKLVPISKASAEQRAGRAGRLRPGTCLRLWSSRGKLEARSRPEILREPLPDLVLRAAACGAHPTQLPFLDPPPDYAVDAAIAHLVRLGCLDADGAITTVGHDVLDLPLPVDQARFLVAARQEVEAGESPSLLADAVDLVAALASGRRLLRPIDRDRGDELSEARRRWADARCDASSAIWALRGGHPERDGLDRWALHEGRRVAAQLRGLLALRRPDPDAAVDRRALARAWIAADPKRAYVRRGRREAFSNQGEELLLANESLVSPDSPAIVVAERFAVRRRNRVVKLASCAIPTPLALLDEAELGRVEVSQVEVTGGRLVALHRRRYAGQTLSSWEAVPTGELARRAVFDALQRGLALAEPVAEARERVAAWNLYRRMEGLAEAPAVDFEAWLEARIEELGIASGADLALILPQDLAFRWPVEVSPDERARFLRRYPRRLEFSEGRYRVTYDVVRRVATLVLEEGSKRYRPPLTYLPPWPGWSVHLKRGNAVSVLRER